MTALQAYVLFGIPLIALGLGFGALWLTKPGKHDPRTHKHG